MLGDEHVRMDVMAKLGHSAAHCVSACENKLARLSNATLGGIFAQLHSPLEADAHINQMGTAMAFW